MCLPCAEHHWMRGWSWLVLLPDEIGGLSLCLELWVSAYDLSALQPGPVPPSGSPHPDTGPHWFSRQRGLSWKPDPTQATPPKVQEPACTSLSPRPGAPSGDAGGPLPDSPPRCVAARREASSGTRAGNMPGGPGVPPGSRRPPALRALPLPGDRYLPQLPCPRWCSIPHTLACTHSHARTCSVTNHTQ